MRVDYVPVDTDVNIYIDGVNYTRCTLTITGPGPNSEADLIIAPVPVAVGLHTVMLQNPLGLMGNEMVFRAELP